MKVIELGLVTGDSAPGPAGRSRRPRVSRRAAAVVAAGCVLTLALSAPIRSHAPLPLWTMPLSGSSGDAFAVREDGVFVLSVKEHRLTRYDPYTGVVRWVVPVAGPMIMLSSIGSGVIQLAIENEPAGGDRIPATRITLGLDLATGRQLWQLPGELAFTRDRWAVAADWNETYSALHVVDVRTGRTAWTHPTGRLKSWSVTEGRGPRRLMTATTDGQVEVRDLADGRLVASRGLSQLRPSRGVEISFGVADDLLLTQRLGAGRAILTAYDPATLSERWRLDGEPFSDAYGCSPVICVFGTAGVSGYDPATGERRWHRPGSGSVIPLGAGLLLDQTGASPAAVDAATGRTLVDLGVSGVIGNEDGGDGPFYLLRPTRQPPGRTAVGRLDGRTGEVFWQGLVDAGEGAGCQAAGPLMACATYTQLSIIDLARTDVAASSGVSAGRQGKAR